MTFDREVMLRDVGEGLSSRPRQLSPKYFYDERGSRLFDEITRLPEYYPTRAERSLLEHHVAKIISVARPATLLELGAGSSDKTRILLEEMIRCAENNPAYIPVDVSEEFLATSAARLKTEYPSLDIRPVAADFASDFALPPHPSPTLHAFLGSTIGNFVPDDAVALLASARERMCPGDFFLLGVDLRKDPAVIERAYNDSRGVTADFNRNILSVINDELGANFDTTRFDHNAIYNRVENRIEMRLIARGDQEVRIPAVGSMQVADGESILTEFSYKYDERVARDVLRRSGLRMTDWLTDARNTFGLALACR
ncbi:MAG: L-histidine N(alpha)-methyltransferase [Gemmatimonadota bacterium]|nr:L-histidine N(alpha)-methyltransferase [Gemmatimonadota bacterium]